MKLVFVVVGGSLLLIAVLVAVAYICDRFQIGTTAPAAIPAVQCNPVTAEDYVAVGQLLMQSVSEFHSSLGLMQPKDFAFHAADQQTAVQQRAGVGCVLTYYFDRGRDVGNGGVLSTSRLPPSTVDTSVMLRKLSAPFANACIFADLGSYQILNIVDVPNQRVRFEILRRF